MAGPVTVKILRSGGADEPEGRFQSYRITPQPKQSVLDLVTAIQNGQDPTLAFRYSCRAGMCGTCAMRVNGKNRWTCRTSAEALGDTIVLEPLPNYPVLRDLAVDMAPFFKHYRRVNPAFCPADPAARDFAAIRPDGRERREINLHVECIGCGCCFGACGLVTSNSAYAGPAALNRAYAAICDSRDGAAAERLDLIDSHGGVWGCHTQFNCGDACPVGISPTRAIQKLKRKEVGHAFARFFR